MKWYANQGEQSDVVLSTRVRLARNLRDFPFPARLDAASRSKINELVRDTLNGKTDEPLQYIEMPSLTRTQALSLAERRIVSPEFATSTEGRALLISEDEKLSIMLCEEDHIRLQVMLPGLALDEAYEQADRLDGILEASLDYAFDERIGYLTQCPTNLGTGLRASVMLHLPALTAMGSMAKLAATVAKLGLTLRGAYGEGNTPTGDIYQLSNQVTLGISEQAALQNLKSIATQIISQERQSREAIVSDERRADKIYRAYGILKSARMISSSEFLQLSSLVRLGISQKLIDVDMRKLNELLITTQPATLNAENGGALQAAQRDVLRAQLVREALN